MILDRSPTDIETSLPILCACEDIYKLLGLIYPVE